jgi:hypothetical protein
MQILQANAKDEALAKQAVVYAVAMLKGEGVGLFTTDYMGSAPS